MTKHPFAYFLQKLRHGHQTLFHRRLRADPDTIRKVLIDLRHDCADLAADLLARLELVLAEIMNNMAEHGRAQADGSLLPSYIHLCVFDHPKGVACILGDNGQILPPTCLIRSDLTLGEPLAEGGFGWFIIRETTRSLCYFRGKRRNYLTFVIPQTSDSAQTPTKAQFSADCKR